jgi:hypothetical protein
MIQPTPPETPLEELHRIRREIAERFDENVFAIAEDAAKRLAESGRPIWKRDIGVDSAVASGKK